MNTLKFFTLTLVFFCVFGTVLSQNNISGIVNIYGETDFSGIKVKAIRTAPTPLSDSTITNSVGEFSMTLEDGIYYLEYSRLGCLTLTSETIAVYDDVVVSTVTLYQNGISGYISGVLPAGVYVVTDDLILHEDSSLIIEPGTRLYFFDDVKFDVNGFLTAEGTASDSIIMTSYKAFEFWNGLKINEATSDSSSISYARISRSHAHGICIINSSIKITHSVICDNLFLNGQFGSLYGGAGIMALNSSSLFDNISVRNNFSDDNTGGIYIVNNLYGYYSDFRITNSQISKNHSYNGSSGLYYSCAGRLILENVIVSDNFSEQSSLASGVSIEGSDDIILTNVLISGNSISNSEEFMDGGALTLGRYWNGETSFKLTNVTISGGDIYNGIYIWNNYDVAKLVMTNCVIANQRGYAIYDDLWESNPNIITNSLFWNNQAGNINYDYDWFGEILTTNANGLECDPWYNIFVDPKFVDSLNGDYRLSQLSPCIDAGENDSIYLDTDLIGVLRIIDGNGDGNSVVDIGAYEFDSTLLSNPINDITKNEVIVFPNPTNGITNVNLVEVSRVIVYDFEGRQVDLIIPKKNEINISHLDSGIYSLVIFSKEGINVVRIIKV